MKEIYDLSGGQMPYFRDFQSQGEGRLEKIIGKVTTFIQGQLGYDPNSGGCLMKAVVGVSGGVDSAVTLALAVRAVGPENVIAVKMPYDGVSSQESIDYANLVIEKFGVAKSFQFSIKKVVDAEIESLVETGIEVSPFVKGNIMARMRMVKLYALANTFGGMVLDTCNRTEVLLGYFTKYGDGASDFNPVGNIYKSWIWLIAKYIGVPDEIIRKVPSAELEDGQSDENDMGITYQALDLLLYFMFDKKASDADLSGKYLYPVEVVSMVQEQIKKSAHKRGAVPVCVI